MKENRQTNDNQANISVVTSVVSIFDRIIVISEIRYLYVCSVIYQGK